MNKAIAIIIGTPIWVWGILIYLIFVGIKAINTRIVYLPKIFIIPLVLMAVKYKTFLSNDVLMFISIIITGSIFSFWIHRYTKVNILKEKLSVEIPGNYTTLIILLAFFSVKYFFGYLNDAMPAVAVKYKDIELLTSGLFSGYFLGRAMRYFYQFYRGKHGIRS